jgi:long-chain fatty acid transport protein
MIFKILKEHGVNIRPIRTLVSIAVLSSIANTASYAGAFSLYTESSPAAIGNYAAGSAAEAADASIGWYNPAGLPLLKKQELVVGGVGVFPKAEISGSSTYSTVSALPIPPFVQTFNNINAGDSALVPSVHYALPVGDRAAFGLSIVAPFGLATDWGTASPVRYQATFTDLVTANVSPELGAMVTDNFSVGAGLDLQYAQVKFNQMIGIPTVLDVIGLPPTAADTLSYNKGTSFSVGYHVGIMALFNDQHTRVGLNYQSQMRHQFNGFSRLNGPLATPGNIFALPAASTVVNNNLSSGPITLPDVLTLSAYQDLNDRWAVLGSVLYTGWSSFKVIQLYNVVAPAVAADGTITPVAVNNSAPQYYKDVWRAALGVNYHLNEAWMLKVGGGYDQTPTTNAYRDVRLPDADRWALSAGAHYQMRSNIGFDVGYTHLFAVRNTLINETAFLNATTTSSVNAIATASADLVGVQVVWTIDQPVVATKSSYK